MKIFLKLFFCKKPVLITGWILTCFTMEASAQYFGNSSQVSDPFESQYFTNRYLANPSMAGIDSGLMLHAAYRQQYSGMSGAPVTGVFSADDNPGKRVGLGLIAYNDKAGLINRTRFAITYAYHLPLNNQEQNLHFGISAAFAHTSLDTKGIIGDPTDPAIAQFNERKNNFEMDYGMAYTDPHITLQASLFNILGYVSKFGNNTADVSTFYAAAAYKFTLEGTVNSLEPEVAFQGVKNYNSILNIGANLIMLQHILNLTAMVGTQGNVSLGTGVTYKNKVGLQLFYLSQTTKLRNYTNGNFEIALSLFLARKK
ncbi:MAG: type IX secretion system membrane protein PorP/SprF [Chitinophagaceae bacterium]|nr:MAG: type IX secretion system membrane protein PorP/SprF [Chitinophagaceae bacterium]